MAKTTGTPLSRHVTAHSGYLLAASDLFAYHQREGRGPVDEQRSFVEVACRASELLVATQRVGSLLPVGQRFGEVRDDRLEFVKCLARAIFSDGLNMRQVVVHLLEHMSVWTHGSQKCGPCSSEQRLMTIDGHPERNIPSNIKE